MHTYCLHTHIYAFLHTYYNRPLCMKKQKKSWCIVRVVINPVSPTQRTLPNKRPSLLHFHLDPFLPIQILISLRALIRLFSAINSFLSSPPTRHPSLRHSIIILLCSLTLSFLRSFRHSFVFCHSCTVASITSSQSFRHSFRHSFRLFQRSPPCHRG